MSTNWLHFNSGVTSFTPMRSFERIKPPPSLKSVTSWIKKDQKRSARQYTSEYHRQSFLSERSRQYSDASFSHSTPLSLEDPDCTPSFIEGVRSAPEFDVSFSQSQQRQSVRSSARQNLTTLCVEVSDTLRALSSRVFLDSCFYLVMYFENLFFHSFYLFSFLYLLTIP